MSAHILNLHLTSMNEKIEKIVQHTWTLRAAKFGYVIRGIIYLFAGLLGLQLALGIRESGGSLTEAIVFISKQNFGRFFLVVIITGLLSYSLWGILRGVFNVFEKEDNISGYLTRLGYLSSAVSYGAFAFIALAVLQGFDVLRAGGEHAQMSQTLLKIPFGRELLIIIGLCWVISGVVQASDALRAKFKENLKVSEIRKQVKHWPVLIGKVGILSRGIIFSLVGYFIIQAALDFDPKDAYGSGEVLEFLSHLTFGPLIVGVLSVGILSFGCFSIISAWLVRIPKE